MYFAAAYSISVPKECSVTGSKAIKAGAAVELSQNFKWLLIPTLNSKSSLNQHKNEAKES